MGVIYNTRVVTDGLVLCLDAGNRRSYPGTGTVWSDLSGNGNDGTLTNGPTFNGGNGGSIVFDGTNDRVLVSDNQSLKPISVTISAWVYKSTTTNGYVVFKQNTRLSYFEAYTLNSAGFTIADGSGAVGSQRSVGPGQTIPPNQWYHIVGTFRRPDLQFYYNGILTQTNTADFPLNYGILPLSIGSSNSNNFDLPLSGRVSNILIYNRALSAQEILQNFNATRGRYGI